MRFWLVVISLVFAFVYSKGQEICGTNSYLTYLESIDSGITDNVNETFFQAIKDNQVIRKTENDTIYRIQTVFHVVYNNEEQNLDDSLIYSQLDVLNECFRRTNADTVNTREIFLPVAADTKIEFVLAEVDPDGNPTSGIVKKQTTRPTFGVLPTNLGFTDLVKDERIGSGAWDTEKYLNIWVCDLSAQGFLSLYGYAYPPTGSPNWPANNFASAERQGVVVHYEVVGRNNPNRTLTGDRTTVHEVGHYLGLRHIWGDGPCGADDFMKDTPRARRASNGCNKGINTCAEIGDEEQQPDMLENYMDYSTEECQNMFTNDQAAQMRMILTTFRSGIYEEQIIRPEPVVTFEKITFYPNPATNVLNIYMPDFSEEISYNFRLYNTLGQEVLVTELQSQQNQEISLNYALSGAYIYRIFADDKPVSTGRLIIN